MIHRNNKGEHMIKVSSYIASHTALLQNKSFVLAGEQELEVSTQDYIDFLGKPQMAHKQFSYSLFAGDMLMVHYFGGYDQIYGSKDELRKIMDYIDTQR
jgi:hypothetical protein